jgi:SAM-dependent methyltransferase
MVSTVPARRKGPAGLTSAQARRFYDWFGRAQDLQAFYEAARLLDGTLPANARYVGADISGTMTALARARLRASGGRAPVIRADVTRPLPVAAGMFDRFVAVYLLDLLASGDAAALLAEARRVLRPGGLLCTASLTPGVTPAARLVSGAWAAAWSRAPWLTGGCRPVTVAPLLDGWHIEHRAQISAWALTCEVVIAGRP